MACRAFFYKGSYDLNMSSKRRNGRIFRGILTTMGPIGVALALSGAPAAAWEMRVCADPNYMPQSHGTGSGYENKIAKVLADEMGAELTFQWWQLSPSMVDEQLREGNCDMMVGVPDSRDGVLPTIAYYRSPYAFVYREDEDYDISTFDDEVLKDLRLGVTAVMDNPHLALSNRGLAANVVESSVSRNNDPKGPFSGLVEDVAKGEIDVAVPWGPVAGYYAAQQNPPLKVVPAPEFDFPFTPMYTTIVIAVRSGDESLRDQLDTAIARRWDDIQAVLAEYHVPTLDLPRPTLSIGEQQ